MSIHAEVIEGEGLSIRFTATGRDETRLRQMFNNVKDDGDINLAMEHLLNIAIDAVLLVEKHQHRVHPYPR